MASSPQQLVLLSDDAIEELVDDKAKLTEYSTATLAQAMTAAVLRIRDPKTPASAVSSVLDALRKVRADLTGEDHEKNRMPMMMVNIQMGAEGQDSMRSICMSTSTPSALSDTCGTPPTNVLEAFETVPTNIFESEA